MPRDCMPRAGSVEVTEDGCVKVYLAMIWAGDSEPGLRVSVEAESLAEARSRLGAEYGEGTVCSVWSEEDANRPR
jgi:hypothetical protein